MKFDIDFERTFPHPIEIVWRALTDREALGVWLMETDFVAEPDRSFEMWYEDGEGGTDRYVCKIVEIESPNRIVWSWVLDGRQAHGETRVDFRLEEVSGGTRLSVRHSGDRDPDTIERFRAGWPVKLDHLDNALWTGSLG